MLQTDAWNQSVRGAKHVSLLSTSDHETNIVALPPTSALRYPYMSNYSRDISSLLPREMQEWVVVPTSNFEIKT